MLAMIYNAARRLRSAAGPAHDAGHAIERLEWALAHGRPAPRVFERPSAGSEDPSRGVYQALRAGGVLAHPGGELAAICTAVAERQLPSYRQGQDELLGVLRWLGPDAFVVGAGPVAVPHPRRPIVLPVNEPALTLCLLDDALAVGPARVEVRALFMLICPRVREHLAILARLSRLLADQAFVRLLDDAQSHEAIADFAWLDDCGLSDEEYLEPVRVGKSFAARPNARHARSSEN